MPQELLVVHVQVHVKPDAIEAFRAATLVNGASSRREPGVVRFDVIQELDDPTRFLLVEVYRGEAGAAAHKETAHYKTWRDAVAPLMAEPRVPRRYAIVAPDPAEW
jgi:(4S)-4-hydroxy-5-phosphonooxypentane-2,3-dione isomerase